MITRQRFINRLLPTAVKMEGLYSIPRLACIAQAAHESNWGESELTKIACNLFGMTAGSSWTMEGKPVSSIQTLEYSKLPPNKIRYWNRPNDVLSKREDGNGGSILKVVVDFRKYRSWDDSLIDWAHKIALSDQYRFALQEAKQNAVEPFFKALQKAGYATDPEYSAKLMRVYQAVLNLTSTGDKA